MLRWLTDASLADSIAGDLEEQRRRRARTSPMRATLWFWRSAVALVIYLLARRLRDAANDLWRGLRPGSRGEWRQAFRSLRRTPWYSLTIVGVIALAISLTTTVFAIVDGVLFKPLPYPRASELFRVGGTPLHEGASPRPVSPYDIAALSNAVPSALFSLYGEPGGSGANLGDLRQWIPVIADIGQNYFDVLGVRPFIGGFTPADYEPVPGLPVPALISHGLWRRQFGGRPDVIGQVLTEYAETYGPRMSWRIAGVLPEGFQFPTTNAQPNIVTPLVPTATEQRRRRFDAIVRVPADVSADVARERFNAAAARIDIEPSRQVKPWTATVLVPLADSVTKGQAPAFRRVFWASMALLLLAGVSVAGLVASRSMDRRAELVLREALGASAAQLARLVFIECAIVSIAGGLVGLAMTRTVIALILPLIPDNVGFFTTPVVDVRVAGFALLASVATTIGVALWPIRTGMRRSARPVVAAGPAATPRRSTGRFVVIASQVGLGLILTAIGAFMVNSLFQVRQINPGFVPDHLFVVTAEVVNAPAPADRLLKISEFLQRIRAVPGVTDVGATPATSILRRGVSSGPFEDQDVYPVTAGFFAAAGIGTVDGRLPSEAEIELRAPVVIISEAVARQFFGTERAIGRTIARTDREPAPTVIGVVKETRLNGWDFAGYGGEVYMPFTTPSTSVAAGYFTTLVRANPGADDAIDRALRTGAGAADLVRISRVATARELLDDTIRPRRFRSWMFGGAAAMALLIVACSVLGLIAMSTARRTREIGIRVALGATQSSTVGLLIREQGRAVVAGLAVGGVAAVWAVRLQSAQFFQTQVTDPIVWASAVGLIVGAAVLGAFIPAVRASRVDPVKALRVD